MTNASQVDLVGVGLNATDTLISMATFPTSGSKVEYLSSNVLPGGQVASAVVACQQWGMRTRYVGKLGEDEGARLHREAFSKAGVDARIITAPGCPSAHSLILIDGQGERTVLCRRDERVGLQPEDLRREWIETARLLHVDGYDTAAATQAARWARAAGIPVVADLDDLYPGVEELIELVDYLIVSRDFPLRLMAETDLNNALRRMRSRFGCRLTAATLGQEGALAWDGERLHYAAAYRVPVVDTTGAGDIFHAGFIQGLLLDWPLQRQLDFACAAAALNCMGTGARGGIESVERIEELMTTGERDEMPHYSTSLR
jgi:sugar/nucleoside kinase (ribokinase family)